jgi:hypothetical protein
MRLLSHVNLKKNCWEFNRCGREPGGKNVRELGICRASTDTKSNGFNNGVNGGRICWTINGTFCNRLSETYDRKPLYARNVSCISCYFFKKVKQEEGFRNFKTLKMGTVNELKNIIIVENPNN